MHLGGGLLDGLGIEICKGIKEAGLRTLFKIGFLGKLIRDLKKILDFIPTIGDSAYAKIIFFQKIFY